MEFRILSLLCVLHCEYYFNSDVISPNLYYTVVHKLDECTTLWGMPEQVHMLNVEQLETSLQWWRLCLIRNPSDERYLHYCQFWLSFQPSICSKTQQIFLECDVPSSVLNSK